MARLFTVGAELRSTTAGMEWTTSNGTLSISTTTKRSGAASLAITSSASQSRYIEFSGMTANAMFTRIFFRFSALATDAETAIVQHVNGSTVLASIGLRTDGKLRLHDGDIAAAQIGSDSAALSANTWYCIMLKTDNGAATEVDARVAVDGTEPTTFASGAMTAALDATIVDIGIIDWCTSLSAFFDDIVIQNDTGSYQNSWPSYKSSLVLALPTGAGDNAATTGVYSYINEIPPSNTATSGSTMVELDTDTTLADYNMTDSSTLGIGSSDTIVLVDVKVRVREESTTGAPSAYNLRIKSASGGSVQATSSVDAGNTTVRTNPDSTTAFTNRLIAYVDPTTSAAWTPTGTNSIDNMQCGIGCTDSDPDVWVLWLGAYIEYEVAAATSAVKDIVGCGIIPFAR